MPGERDGERLARRRAEDLARWGGKPPPFAGGKPPPFAGGTPPPRRSTVVARDGRVRCEGERERGTDNERALGFGIGGSSDAAIASTSGGALSSASQSSSFSSNGISLASGPRNWERHKKEQSRGAIFGSF